MMAQRKGILRFILCLFLGLALCFGIMLKLYFEQLSDIKNEIAFLKEQDRFVGKLECDLDNAIYEVEKEEFNLEYFDCTPPKMEETQVKRMRISKLTNEEEEILCRIVEAEATGEDLLGKKMVADVVINRCLDKRFPETVKEVVFQSCLGRYQFSPICDGRFFRVSISDDTKKAVHNAIYGEDDTNGALYFVAPKTANQLNLNWFRHSLCLKVAHGGHCFYR